MEASRLTQKEIRHLHQNLPGWTIRGEKLIRQWKFKNFVHAFGFISRVALIAESMNHHPDLHNVYGTVTIELTTHDLDGLSNLDLILAQRINELE